VRLTDESFARAIIEFADAFAKGDDGKVQGLLDAGANNLLGTLVETGEWEASTKPIEAVRIVYAGSYDASMAMSSGAALAGFDMGSMSQMVDQLKEAISAGAGTGALDVLEASGQIPAEQLAVMREQMEKMQGKSAEEIGEEIKAAFAALSGGGAEGGAGDLGGAVPTRGMLLAIQDPRGAYLLGWGASQVGDTWRFTNAPAANGDRTRASAWDGIGPLGFLYTSITAGPTPNLNLEGLGDGADTDTPGADGGAPSESDPSGPTRKNTPSGPVTIPGSG
jgi:hypothetical protein